MTRVAFKILLHDRAKYLALVLGIAFSTLLIAQQTSIFWSVIVSTTQALRQANAADIWVMRPSVEHVDSVDPLPEIAVNRVRSVAGVAWAVPYYQNTSQARTAAGLLKAVTLIGVDDASWVAAPVGQLVMGDLGSLVRPDAVILDTMAFSQLFPDQPHRLGDVVEIGQARAQVVGICRVPPSWAGIGFVYTRRSNAARMARETLSPVSFVLARAREGLSPEEVARRVSRTTGLAAYSRAEFATKTVVWFLVNSGVAENFGVTIAMGLIIGVVIVGQTFYMFSADNLKQFAALKAIGIGNRAILGMLMTQATSVAAVGFGLGVGAAGAFFGLFARSDSGGLRGMYLPPEVFWATAAFVFIMTNLACIVSARRVLVVDPAIVFRG